MISSQITMSRPAAAATGARGLIGSRADELVQFFVKMPDGADTVIRRDAIRSRHEVIPGLTPDDPVASQV
jgi:hypothetical protein